MQTKPPAEARASGTLSLRVLILFLVAFGVGLFEVVGLPHAPNPPLELPDPASLEALLRSSHPPLDGAIYVAGMLGWAVWIWLVLSLVLQVVVAVAERVAAGTEVFRQASFIADLLSAPLVRQAVRTSLAGGMMARVALAGVPTAAAAPPDHSALVVSVSPDVSARATGGTYFWASSEDPSDDIPRGAIVYTVQPGDNLVRIAERFYADGDKWQLLYETNQGRRMADGRTFDRAGVIQPSWQLILPEPTVTIETDADGQRWYTVRPGDSLAAISARLLGDEQRWPELYAANEGVRLDDQHVLRDPRLIWPGLALRLPDLDGAPPQVVGAAPEPEPPPAKQAAPEEPTVVATPPPVPPAPLPAVIGTTAEVRGSSVPATAEVNSRSATPEPTDRSPVDTSRSTAPVDAAQRQVSPAVGGALGALAGVAAVAGTALVLRRRHRRPDRTQPESDVAVNAGYAEAEPAEEFGASVEADDLNAASFVAARISREVAVVMIRNRPSGSALPLGGASLAAVRRGRSSTTPLLQDVPMAARQELIEALPEAATSAFGARCDVEGMVSFDGDVLVRLTALATRPRAQD